MVTPADTLATFEPYLQDIEALEPDSTPAPTEEEMEREYQRARWEQFDRELRARAELETLDSTQLEAYLLQEGYF